MTSERVPFSINKQVILRIGAAFPFQSLNLTSLQIRIFIRIQAKFEIPQYLYLFIYVPVYMRAKFVTFITQYRLGFLCPTNGSVVYFTCSEQQVCFSSYLRIILWPHSTAATATTVYHSHSAIGLYVSKFGRCIHLYYST